MPDWRLLLRSKLAPLPIGDSRAEEILEELAQQLEAKYEEARALGAGETQAIQTSLAQFADWEKLRHELFAAVEGARLPLWQQRGVLSPRRAAVWVLLAIAALLSVLPASRQALLTLPVVAPELWKSARISQTDLVRVEQSGDLEKYGRTLAFTALHDPDMSEAEKAALRAISLDPKWTWVTVRFARSNSPDAHDLSFWIARLKAWDPGNAFPLLLEGELFVKKFATRHGVSSVVVPRDLYDSIRGDRDWRNLMEKAFAAPRMDSYAARQFQLDRAVLEETHPDRPELLLLASASVQLPDLLSIQRAGEYELDDAGAAGIAGHLEIAREKYESVAQFGDALQRDSTRLVQSVGMALSTDAYRRLSSVLRSEGRDRESATFESFATQLTAMRANISERDRGMYKSRAREARLVMISSLAFLIFASGSLLWLLLALFRRRRPARSSLLDGIVAKLQFAPPLWTASSAVLYLSYYPHAFMLSDYSTPRDLWESYGIFRSSLLNDWQLDLASKVWIGEMYTSLIWCAAIAMIGAVAIYMIIRHRHVGDNLTKE